MNEPSGSRPPRDAFAVLVAARPEPSADLTSPESRDADELFRRIVDSPTRPRSEAGSGRRLSIAVGAAAAAAAVGILLTVPGRAGPSSVGSAEPTTPPPTAQDPPAEAPGAWPEIEQSPQVGDDNTARATMIVNGDISFGRTDFTMVDGDVNLAIFQAPVGLDGAVAGQNAPPTPTGPPQLVAENRYVSGEWYYNFQTEDGGMQWSYDPNDEPIFVGLSPSDPRELHDVLAPTATFEADGADFVRGVETVHLVATTPEAVDPSLVQFDPAVAESIESLELWVDSNGVVLRIDVATSDGSPPLDSIQEASGEIVLGDDGADGALSTTYSVEFYDIGEPITVDVPRDAVEIDAQG